MAQQDRSFTADVAYDTLVVRGTVDETNELFLYEGLTPTPMLVDSTSVLFGDKSGRLVYADLLTGEGWEVGGDAGNGPGEFGGGRPVFSESGGFIYTAASNLQGATWTRAGDLVEARRYPEPFLGGQFPMGLLRLGVVVSYYSQTADHGREGQQLVQEIRAYSRNSGLIWVYPLPSIEATAEPIPGGGTRIAGRGAAVVRARHSTVVWSQNHGTEVVALNGDGSVRRRRSLQHEVFEAFVASDERIWVHLRALNARRTGSYMVLDRDLNFVLNVTEGGVQDAWGDYLLTLSFDANHLPLLHLLRARPVHPARNSQGRVAPSPVGA